MGVHGLWTVVQPCARPIKLETLNKKRLAVDASIWIYQFLKAVRDKEGNALRNSHIVGFFRRICKLLYFGIKPVFVFDGGAPILKRQTITNRKKRREGRREDAVRTAGKLLAVQLQRSAEEAAAASRRRATDRVEEVPDNPVYVEDAFMTEKEKTQTRAFRKKDAYHLPDMQVSLEEMGAPNDPRIMSREELEEYARQFHQGEDINLYDFSKIDFDSPFFVSLPATDRYNILNAARLRSRLRMGYSKEQLDTMFPDRMAFSKFQIERVKERNDLTQRLMNINGMNGEEAFYKSGQRIAGERGKEYVLVKDNTIEGGWVLGVVGNKEGQEDKPIDVDQYGQHQVVAPKEEFSDDSDGGFEDVPIEGLNRLPKLPFLRQGAFDESLMDQMRGELDRRRPSDIMDDDSLFVRSDRRSSFANDGQIDGDDMFHDPEDNDEELQRAIQMSLEAPTHVNEDKDMPEIQLNRNENPLSQYRDEPVDLMDESEDDFDFAAALAQSKRTEKTGTTTRVANPFAGPLPFESMQLMKPSQVNEAPKIYQAEKSQAKGGEEATKAKKEALPLPPWFSAAAHDDHQAGFIAEEADNRLAEESRDEKPDADALFVREKPTGFKHSTGESTDRKEVISLDSESEWEEILPESSNASTTHTSMAAPSSKRSIQSQPPASSPDQNLKAVESNNAPEASLTNDIKTGENDGLSTARSESSPTPEFEDVAIPYADMADNAEPAAEDVFEDVLITNGDSIDSAKSPTENAPVYDLVETGDGIEQDDFSDPEDEDLMQQLAAEGEEHVRFAAALNSEVNAGSAFDYEQELKQLRFQQKKDRRDADEVSQVMITECQQLLALFGLPYITAPMEAEAQCAELVSLGLVDGIITDDSDCFLFGGTRIYKNMFNQGKFVECYLSSDLEKEYALHRTKLIRLAHLLGSDYTEGIPGIGPVTALEILTEFADLEEFNEWWTRVQTGANLSENEHAAFYKRFKKQAAKIFLPPSFPDHRVDVAYLEPEVDSDPSPFQWGVPDLHGLRNFLMSTIGWSQERTDEILVPVIRDMNRREQEGTQSNITNFFTGPQGAGAFAPRVRSGGQSRMEKAFRRLQQQAGNIQEEPEAVDGEAALTTDLLPENQPNNGAATKRGARRARQEQDKDKVSNTKKRKIRGGAKQSD
ncbi:ssDNA endodeoxyribonuclease RAD2 [Aspergillus saccharolyticus JOP 1030-1]|uniref:DNA excision repair protein Rad2 n=1 Tax=Aspergillus saccharolyticus JOP 1030-1 TaxID=1450539 RepID=A0A318ZPZ0_9EURO|nr:DNA excision repair protein Rad2 [Aspergillus saccharolyticus JOP 1030-1]PYH49669.1 DNA excision repair protein Rad2 [Aspergillus saccharolyticus JOP 1030-1]